jgi:Protein kinase domain
MALLSGTRLGPYEVLSLLGSGGMGEVYRARDARLRRDVALKLLPATVAADPDRPARFTREAQVLAALNHPNIGAIYGIEESEGITALVLELVEGPTLAERILSGTTRKDVFTIEGELLDSPVYSPSSHIVFQRETTAPGVWAVPFSLDRLEVTGDPFMVAPQGSWPSVGANGLLLYANDQLSGSSNWCGST